MGKKSFKLQRLSNKASARPGGESPSKESPLEKSRVGSSSHHAQSLPGSTQHSLSMNDTAGLTVQQLVPISQQQCSHQILLKKDLSRIPLLLLYIPLFYLPCLSILMFFFFLEKEINLCVESIIFH